MRDLLVGAVLLISTVLQIWLDDGFPSVGSASAASTPAVIVADRCNASAP